MLDPAIVIQKLVQMGLCNNLSEGGLMRWATNSSLENEGIEAHCGVTKACFWCEGLENWVIKVGFSNLTIDYAALEYEIYTKAVRENLEEYFPITFFVGAFEGVNFYLQQRARCDCDSVLSILIESVSQNTGCYNYTDAWDIVDDLDSSDRALMLFDSQHLANFLTDNHVNDLHEGNFGYIGDKLVIIDFSGWKGY